MSAFYQSTITPLFNMLIVLSCSKHLIMHRSSKFGMCKILAELKSRHPKDFEHQLKGELDWLYMYAIITVNTTHARPKSFTSAGGWLRVWQEHARHLSLILQIYLLGSFHFPEVTWTQKQCCSPKREVENDWGVGNVCIRGVCFDIVTCTKMQYMNKEEIGMTAPLHQWSEET